MPDETPQAEPQHVTDRRATRTIGRVRVAYGEAPLLPVVGAHPSEGTGISVETNRDDDDTVHLRFTTEDGTLVATYVLAGGRHVDPWYGEYSLPTATHCYASDLEVLPAARGRGIGTLALRTIRWTAANEFGRGVKHLTARDNLEIRHMSTKVGIAERLLLDGVRLGGNIHWVRRRAVTE